MSPGPRDRVAPAYLALFVALYAVQGIVFAYFINFNQKYMLAAGVPEAAVVSVQVWALMPFVFKFLVGPLSDRFSPFGLGHRKPYIVVGLLLQAGGLVALSWTDPGKQLWAFGATALLTVSGLALYDTCCDGMIVNVTPADDRSRVQGLLMFARFLMATVFSLGFGYWLDRTGTGPGKGYRVLWTCSGLSLIPLALMLALPEPPRSPEAEAFSWKAFGVLLKPRSLVLLAYGTFYSVVAYGAEINLPLFYDHLGFGQGDVGLFGASRNLGRAAGSLLLPLGAAYLSRRNVLRVAILGLAGATALQAAVGGRGGAVGFGFLFGAANGWADAIFFVMAMEASDPRLAASTYALFMAVSNLSVTGGWFFSAGSGLFGGRYRPTFLLASGVTALALVFIRPLARPQPTRDEDWTPSPEPPDAVVA